VVLIKTNVTKELIQKMLRPREQREEEEEEEAPKTLLR